MKENKFRGRVLYNGNHYFAGEWVVGFYYENRKGESYIIDIEPDEFGNASFSKVQVDPETVGQYVGITGKDRELYEGDLVRYGYVILYNKDKALFAEHDRQRLSVMSYPLDLSNVEIFGNIYEDKK